jgi:hypothetical protein
MTTAQIIPVLTAALFVTLEYRQKALGISSNING